MVVADKGSQHSKSIAPDKVLSQEKEVHAFVRARYETCNLRLMQFHILSYIFFDMMSGNMDKCFMKYQKLSL